MIPENTIEEKKKSDKKNNLDRRKIRKKSLEELSEDIENIEDQATKNAVADLAHIITGDDRFDM